MTHNHKHNLLIILMMLAGVALIALSLPHNTQEMDLLLSHEVGKPWRNPTLIAPFDIPIEYDEATKQRITDSVAANFVHFYKHDAQLGEQKTLQLNKALSNQPSLPTSVRYQVVNQVAQLYADGIIDSDAYEQINAGKMQHISLRNGSESTAMATAQMHSVKQAYELLDSTLQGSPYKDAVMQVGLNSYLEPNYTIDEAEDAKWYNDALNTALTPPSDHIVQMGEAIIFTGNKVTPEQDAIINTYKRMVDENAKKRVSSDEYTLLGQVVIVAILFLVFYVYARLMRPRVFANLRRMTFLVTFLTLMVVAVLWIVKFRPNYMYLIPFAITKEQALSVVNQVVSKAVFAPKEVKNFTPEDVRGIYIPYWIVNANHEETAVVRSNKNTGTYKYRFSGRTGNMHVHNFPIDGCGFWCSPSLY